MNTTDKCPHCGAESRLSSKAYACGSTANGWQSVTCFERTAHAATRAELEKVRAELSSLQSRWDSAGIAVTAEVTRIQVKRDRWQRRAERLERALILVADEPNLDRARKIADEALEQKEARHE